VSLSLVFRAAASCSLEEVTEERGSTGPVSARAVLAAQHIFPRGVLTVHSDGCTNKKLEELMPSNW
jgi:hypothetical protein